MLLFLLACGRGPGAPAADCADLECLQAHAVATWPADPRAVKDLVREQADPLARAALVEAVVEAHPGTGADLCGLLEPGITRYRCERIAERPHLWEIQVEDPASVARFSGEAMVTLAPSPSLRVPQSPRVRPVDCGETVPENSCRTRRATEAAMGADLVGATEICAGIGDERWRGECLFDAVEQACRRDQPGPCAVAVELCVAAGPFRTPCLVQVAGELAAIAPPSAGESGDAWATIGGRLREVRQRMTRVDPILGDRFEHRTWAEATMLAYGHATLVGGNPLDFVPAEAAPHVRAAIAWRLVAQRDSGTLAQRAANVRQAEARRTRDAGATAMPLGRVRIDGLWPADLPGEAEIPWVAYLQDARRAVAADPDADARICVLEAAARTSPLDVDTLVEGLGDTDWLVRWTAARLLAAVRPGHAALAHVAADPDPRVRARASGAAEGG